METKYLAINNKLKIAFYCNHINNAKVGIIILHGLAEHKGRYHDFIEQLNKNDISTFAIDLRGHGESLGKRGDVKHFENYIEDLHSFVSYIRNEYPDLKLGMFGHSLGGLIASSYVANYKTIDFLILSSPFLKAPSKAKFFKFIPYKILGFVKLKKRHSESKEMLKYSRNDMLACHYFTLRLVGNMFVDGIQYITERFKDIKLPVLMLGGKLDPLIDSTALNDILDEFGTKDKTIRIYDNVKHRIVQNDNKDEIIADIIKWVKTKIGEK